MRKVNDESPDLVVLLGDMIHRCTGARRHLEALAGLRGRAGVFATLGNREHGFASLSRRLQLIPGPSDDEWRRIYGDLGYELLVNEARPLTRGGARIWIVGVDDAYSGHDDLGRALRDVPPDEFRLVITHHPDLIDDPAVRNVDLILAGHTHGGQVKVPVIARCMLFSCRNPQASAAGLVRAHGTLMAVTRGRARAYRTHRLPTRDPGDHTADHSRGARGLSAILLRAPRGGGDAAGGTDTGSDLRRGANALAKIDCARPRPWVTRTIWEARHAHRSCPGSHGSDGELPRFGPHPAAHVAVYGPSIGAQAIAQALAGHEEIEATVVANLDADELVAYDALYIGSMRLDQPDAVRALRVFVGAGGGLVLNHAACGRDQPKTLDIVARVSGRREDQVVSVVAPEHPIAAGRPAQYEHGYYDHLRLELGPAGTVILRDRSGEAVLVAGEAGPGAWSSMARCPVTGMTPRSSPRASARPRGRNCSSSSTRSPGRAQAAERAVATEVAAARATLDASWS